MKAQSYVVNLTPGEDLRPPQKEGSRPRRPTTTGGIWTHINKADRPKDKRVRPAPTRAWPLGPDGPAKGVITRS